MAEAQNGINVTFYKNTAQMCTIQPVRMLQLNLLTPQQDLAKMAQNVLCFSPRQTGEPRELLSFLVCTVKL